ncbi:MAG TPA: hypothetical protein VIH85_15965 [Solirubrobacteraceae bacterium]
MTSSCAAWHDAFEAELLDTRDEILAPLDHHARRRSATQLASASSSSGARRFE